MLKAIRQSILRSAERKLVDLLKFAPRWHRRYLYRQQMRRLDLLLRSGKSFLMEPSSSLIAYENYDSSEQRLEDEGGGWECLVNDRAVWMPGREIRRHKLSHIIDLIETLRSENITTPLRVLEVGCGNCSNLAELRRVFLPAEIVLHGADISARRIEVAREYYGDRLADVTLFVQSVTTPEFAAQHAKAYDLVFSMHCLEQLPYELDRAVRNMVAVSRRRVAMIEPVFEFGDPAQKCYLLLADYAKLLLPTVRALELDIVKAEPLRIQSSLKNQTSLIVVDIDGKSI